jgi:Tol biopolymer transport system component
VWIAGVDGRPAELVYTSDTMLLEAPNWAPDDHALLLNGHGRLWRLDLRPPAPKRPGHAQLARVPAAGGRLQRLVESDTVDWFPHVSPDAQFAAYVSFPAGTLGHPADLDVEVRLVRTSSWSDAIARYPLFGGQGTMNVNSWSPDSRRFAFMAYPIDAA